MRFVQPDSNRIGSENRRPTSNGIRDTFQTPTTPPPSFLYAPTGSISAYAIDSTTGSLTPIAGSPFPAVNTDYLTLNPVSKVAYVGGGSFSVISTYAIDSQTGFLTLVNTSPQYDSVTGLTLTPDDKFEYVANVLGVIGYTVDKKSGFLTNIAQPQITIGELIRGAVHPSGKFAYFAAPTPNSVFAYAVNPGKGTLTPVPGSPFSAGTQPLDLVMDPCGQFLYTTNYFSGDVSAYVVDQKIGSL